MKKFLMRIPNILAKLSLVVLLFLRDVWLGTLEALARGDHVADESQDDVHNYHWDMEASHWNRDR